MRVIIVGCGRVGSELANALSAERHDVVVIDRSPLSFGRLSREFNGRMLTGVGFDRDTLQKAEIEGAQALAASTDSDNVNIVVAVTAKETFKVPHVVARIYDPQVAEIYRREGIPTVTPTVWAASTMKTLIVHPPLASLSTCGKWRGAVPHRRGAQAAGGANGPGPHASRGSPGRRRGAAGSGHDCYHQHPPGGR
jgi:trk system potassium uptake protein TrkA